MSAMAERHRPAGVEDQRLELYDEVAEQASSLVIRRYSTSFGLAARMLDPAARRHVENIYALVRVADEIVDGGATDAGLDPAAAAGVLDALERETELAMASGYSSNLVVHAFARSARRLGFGTELTRPFFASMRMDLSATEHDEESFRAYVYGSAEVVGLMCLPALCLGHSYSAERRAELVHGARQLGSAFQKINFLRDLGADSGELGRCYFPGVGPQGPTAAQLTEILAEIGADLARARAALPRLPRRARSAVAATLALYDRLLAELAATPPDQVLARRVRVSAPRKLVVLGRVLATQAAGAVPGLPRRPGPRTTDDGGAA